MDRQLYNMGSGEEIMEENVQETFSPQGNTTQVQEGIMQVAPQGAQQDQAEQYRPVAEDLAKDPKKALALLIKMLIEQGIPPEQAEKIAMEMIQGVAEGGMEEVSEDTRVEARFGGRMQYASGGIGRLVDREQYGFGSFFKKITSAPRAIAKGIKSVAKSPLGRMALTVGATMLLGPAGLGLGAGATGWSAVGYGALRGGLANLAVQAAAGGKINFKEALTSAAISGGISALNAPKGSLIGDQSNPTTAAYQNEVSQLNPNIQANTTTPGTEAYRTTMKPYSDFDSFGNTPTVEAGSTGNFASYNQVGRNSFPTESGTNLFNTDAMAANTSMGQGIPSSGNYSNEFYNQAGATDTSGIGLGSDFSDYLDYSDTPSPTYQIGKYGGTTGVEVGSEGVVYKPGQTGYSDMPLSQRYDTFKDSISGGNYMDALKQVSGAALDNPIASTLGISTLAGMSAGQPPEQNPGESMEDYNRRVEAWKTTLNANLGNTKPFSGYKLPSSANNPFYASGGRVSYQQGGRMGYAYGNSVEQGIMSAPQIADQMGMPVGNPRQNQQGIAELDYREEGGFVPPIGIKEKEDDIPAMLSNNEFVFTADAVRNAGGGDPNVGAQKMYSMMKQLENGGRV